MDVDEEWFTRRSLSVRYRRAEGSVGERVVEVVGVIMERHTTLLHCVDASTGEERHLRLDRIEHASVAQGS